MLMRDAFDERVLFYLIQRAQVFLDDKYGLMEQAFQALGQRLNPRSRAYPIIQKNLCTLHQVRFTLERWSHRLEDLEPRLYEQPPTSAGGFDVQGYYWFLNEQANGFESLKDHHRRFPFFSRALKSQLHAPEKYPELSAIQTVYVEIDGWLDQLRSLIHCLRSLVEGLLQLLESSPSGTFERLLAHCKSGEAC